MAYLRAMSEMKAVDLKLFKKNAQLHKRSFRTYLSKLQKNPPRKLDEVTAKLEKEVWEEVDCLSCANCCKTMTPTFTTADMKRISAHFGQTVDEFKEKWLRKERRGDGDWMNKNEPCQFLNLENNKCSIYEIRPVDCAEFPHLTKKMKDYAHVFKQNVEYCPATYKLVEKMMASVSISGNKL